MVGHSLHHDMKPSTDSEIYPPSIRCLDASLFHGSIEARKTAYEASIANPEAHWEAEAKAFYWHSPWHRVLNYNFSRSQGTVFTRWFEGAQTNLSFNALDRWAKKSPDRIAYYWEPNNLKSHMPLQITYGQLQTHVRLMAAVLRTEGVQQDDCVTCYLPMTPAIITVMLACARMGVLLSVVFAGLSANALATRLVDSHSRFVVTAGSAFRGAKEIQLKATVDEAVSLCASLSADAPHKVDRVLVFDSHHFHGVCVANGEADAAKLGSLFTWAKPLDKPQAKSSFIRLDPGPLTDAHPIFANTAEPLCPPPANLFTDTPSMSPSRDVWVHDAFTRIQLDPSKPLEELVWVDTEHPLFLLYTSGSTGTPKGLLHTTGGYMVYATTTFRDVFQCSPEDTYFCTGDVGWITGHTYGVFGPLLNAARSVLFEGIPTFPGPGRFWEICAKYHVNQFYTAPTAIRALMRYGKKPVREHDLSDLRVLGSVGEPINPSAWEWYYDVVGQRRCDVVDTWWQTETGGIMISPLPGSTPMKPGSVTLPLHGIKPVLLNPHHHHHHHEEEEAEPVNEQSLISNKGLLCIEVPWPGIARTIYGNHRHYEHTYFYHDGFYYSGDGCQQDADGYYWILGRMDDVVNVSGHRLGTREVEAAANTAPRVLESAAIGIPHDIKGECLCIFVVYEPDLDETATNSQQLQASVVSAIRSQIGPIATPDWVIAAPTGLPKTRSGKIMRRILRYLATDRADDLGDVTTLSNPSVVPVLTEAFAKAKHERS